MSLLDEAMEACVMMNRVAEPDGYGGFIYVWNAGAPFEAAFSFDQSMAARVASVQGVKDLYTVVTRKNVVLQYHDVIMRSRDGKYFRITSDGEDHATPASAGLDMRAVTAEVWDIGMQK